VIPVLLLAAIVAIVLIDRWPRRCEPFQYEVIYGALEDDGLKEHGSAMLLDLQIQALRNAARTRACVEFCEHFWCGVDVHANRQISAIHGAVGSC